ncbi:MAG: hypothetical protein KGI68_03240 [Alphaproteobacteria bacterium]|nr:hypothetical protein [Alphaproteobacteria bacterium]MDE2266786.1 hypothetical protein [Alphaproteobacteria bacterium]
MPPVSQAPRRYFVELMGAIPLYAAAIFASGYGANQHTLEPVLRDALVLSPVAPILLVALVIFRLYRRVDEFQKRRQLEMIAIGAAVVGIIGASWHFAQEVGAPPLSIVWAWPVMAAGWLVTSAIRGWRDKASEGRLGRALLWWAVNVALMIAFGTVAYIVATPRLGWPANWGVTLLVGMLPVVIRVGIASFSKNPETC